MPTQLTQNFVIKTAQGQTIVLSREEASSPTVETTIDFVCDGPRCATRRNADSPMAFTWRDEEVQKDPLKLPDYFFEFIPPFRPYMTDPNVVVGFCSGQCAKDWLTYSYVRPKSPRASIEAAKKEQEQQLAELNPHLVPAGSGCTENVQPSDADAREEEMAMLTERATTELNYKLAETANELYASAQADGDPGDEHQ